MSPRRSLSKSTPSAPRVQPSLDAMALFVAIVQAGSFTRASDLLGVPKSTLSRRLAALEGQLGMRLIERTTRRLRMTEPGEEYHRRAQQIVADAEAMHREVAARASAPAGRLRIATTEHIGEVYLVPVVAAYLELHPAVEVDLLLSQSFSDLLASDIDLALRVGPLTDSSLIARKLGEARTGYFAHRDYLARRGVPGEPLDLHDHDCVVVSERSERVAWAFVRDERTFTLPIRGRVRTTSLRSCLGLLRAGLGVGRLPAKLVDDLGAGGLLPVLAAYTPLSTTISAVFPSGRLLALKVQAFLDLLATLGTFRTGPRR